MGNNTAEPDKGRAGQSDIKSELFMRKAFIAALAALPATERARRASGERSDPDIEAEQHGVERPDERASHAGGERVRGAGPFCASP